MGDEHRLAKGISSLREVKKSSPTWQAAYRLVEGSRSFNAWRARKRPKFLDLSYLIFRSLDLSGCRLEPFKFRGAIFKEVDLRNASFSGSNLNQARFENCKLDGCDFKQARLVNADFSDNSLDNTNLYATIRDDWIVRGVECNFCWITKDKELYPDSPDRYDSREFELSFGGVRFKVIFPGGIKPIDLLALPHHVLRFLESNKNKRLILAGISTLGDPGLEFRCEDLSHIGSKEELQDQFSETVSGVREEMLHTCVKALGQQGIAIARLAEVLVEKNALFDNESVGSIKHFISTQSGDINVLPGPEGAISRNIYEVNTSGPVGTVGGSFSASPVNIGQGVTQGIDLSTLARDLGLILAKMKEEPGVDAETMQEVAEAKNEATKGDGIKALEHLRKAGVGALKVAKEIGVRVAATVIARALEGGSPSLPM